MFGKSKKTELELFFQKNETQVILETIRNKMDEWLLSYTEKSINERIRYEEIPYQTYNIRIKILDDWIYAIVDNPNIQIKNKNGFWRKNAFFGLDYNRENKIFDYIRYDNGNTFYDLKKEKEIMEQYLHPIMWRMVAINELFDSPDREKNKKKVEELFKVNYSLEIQNTKLELKKEIERKIQDAELFQFFSSIVETAEEIVYSLYKNCDLFEEHKIKLLRNGDLLEMANLFFRLNDEEKKAQRPQLERLLKSILQELQSILRRKDNDPKKHFENSMKLFETRYQVADK